MMYYKDCDFETGIKKILMSFQEEPDIDKYTKILVDWTKRRLSRTDDVLHDILYYKDSLVESLNECIDFIDRIKGYFEKGVKKEDILYEIETLDKDTLFYSDLIEKEVTNLIEDLEELLD